MFSKRLVSLHQRVRYSCGALPKNYLTNSTNKSVYHIYQQLHHPLPSFCIVRNASTNSVVPPVITKAIEASTASSNGAPSSFSVESLVETIGPIPEAPSQPLPKVIEFLANGEPSFTSLGLGGMSPVGVLQHILEYTHVFTDLSWGWTIVVVAAVIRIMCFKLVVRQRQESAKFTAVMPQIQFLQEKIRNARAQNDLLQVSRYSMEYSEFANNRPSMFSSFKFALIQGFILLSFTQALRGMCNLPVESLQTGGFFTVPDLTMTDPSYVLPLINGCLFYLHLVTGKELRNLFATKNPYLVQAGMVGVSTLLFGLSVNFPGAIVLYWISSQCVTVLQYHFLNHPKIKARYKLDVLPGNAKIRDMMKNDVTTKAVNKLGFFKRIKEAQATNRLVNEVKQRSQIDSAAFERAGREPIRKTFKYDVTKLKKP